MDDVLCFRGRNPPEAAAHRQEGGGCIQLVSEKQTYRTKGVLGIVHNENAWIVCIETGVSLLEVYFLLVIVTFIQDRIKPQIYHSFCKKKKRKRTN